MSYIGVNPKEDIVCNTHEYTVPTGGQQTFSVVYDNYVEVFVNGVQLSSSLFTATDGASVTITPTLSVGDTVKVQGFESFKANNNYYNKTDIDTSLAAKANTGLDNVTDATVLAKIKNVDGAGSGLDADTVDGVQASQLVRNDTANTITVQNHWFPLILSGTPSATSGDSLGYALYPSGDSTKRIEYSSKKDGSFRIYQASVGRDALYSDATGQVYNNGGKVWHSGNTPKQVFFNRSTSGTSITNSAQYSWGTLWTSPSTITVPPGKTYLVLVTGSGHVSQRANTSNVTFDDYWLNILARSGTNIRGLNLAECALSQTAINTTLGSYRWLPITVAHAYALIEGTWSFAWEVLRAAANGSGGGIHLHGSHIRLVNLGEI